MDITEIKTSKGVSLIIDSIRDSDSNLVSRAEDGRYVWYLGNDAVYQTLSHYPLSEIRLKFSRILIWEQVSRVISNPLVVSLSIFLDDTPFIRLNFGIEAPDVFPWNEAGYEGEIINEVKKSNGMRYWEDEESATAGRGINYFSLDMDSPLYTMIAKIRRDFDDVAKSAIQTISWRNSKSHFTAMFEFPPEIRTACNQYLIYFGQFLADLGIDSQTEIKQELRQTLFKVIPTDGDESLNKIREALDIFL